MESFGNLLDTLSGEIFFLGIGGSGMYGTAALAKEMGFAVRGTDSAENANTRRLRALGVPLQSEREGLPPSTALLVYTFAAPPDHPLLMQARARAVPTLSRAEFFGMLMRPFPIRAAVAGSHGKSSVTAMCATVLRMAGYAPTVVSGADLGDGRGSFRMGEDRVLLFEACEYRDAFLSFCPTHALALSVSHEHTDYFPDEASVRRSFRRYLSGQSVRKRIAPVGLFDADVTYGEGGSLFARACVCREGGSHFCLCTADGASYPVTLHTGGAFQIENALGAAALCAALGVPVKKIAEGLCTYRGIARRMEYKGSLRGAPLYLDFAHHPKELAALLRSADAFGRPVALVFEGHTYSRTRHFFSDYVHLLRKPHISGVLPIYAAREPGTDAVSGKALAEAARAAYLPTYEDAARFLVRAAGKGCTLLLVGAGGVEGVLPYLSPMLG
ncbi:MAG: hypothetical protein IJV96_04735 [Clostridia bacterium]|nr:hypothetical protein [Clostridia bacterium]